jgi:AcrR family transcriptional regulator
MEEPKQDRSRRTLARLMEGAIEEFAAKPPRDVTIKDVVKRSRSSVGSFYARFDGKGELVSAVDNQLWHELEDRWGSLRQALADRSGDWDLHTDLLEGLATVFEPNASARLAVQLDLAWEGRPSKGGAVLESVRTGLVELLADWGHESAARDPAVAELLAGLVVQRLEAGAPPSGVLDHLATVLTAVLRAPSDRGSPFGRPLSEVADPFDVWG